MRAIDGDALINDCKKYLSILNPDRDGKEYARIFWLISILRSAPTIEPERKTGKWKVHLYKFGRDRYECSECTGRCDLEYDFCPNCGAKMTEEKC